ncbi:MAG: NADH-quinone oxidoreductase subunit C [Acidobacteriota bacterium]
MEKLKDLLTENFKIDATKFKNNNTLIIEAAGSQAPPLLSYLKSDRGFSHLSLISCVDWIEDNKFQLVYILWNRKEKTNLILKCFIDRKKAEHRTIMNIYPVAEIYEREIRELYGVNFEGNPTQNEDFVLEDWEDIPPMRRDFDTLEYSMTNFGRRNEEKHTKIRDVIADQTNEWRKK